jgi:AcrR family transcriptional regulator
MAASSPATVPMTQREASHARRRERILTAAASLFETNGFEGTTTDEIAAAAEVTKRTLYRYVGSKEQLLFEIHENFLRDLLDEVSTAEGTPPERFRKMVHSHIWDLAANLRDVKVFFEESKHLTGAKREELVVRRDSYERAVNEILSDGVDDGYFGVPDIRLTTRAILGAMNEGYRWYRVEDRDPDITADLVTDQFLHGLAAPRRGTGRMPITADLFAGLLAPEATEPANPTDRIVAAATELFSRHGYRGTNTQEIANSAGITKGALFYHVSNKEEALVQIQERLFAEVNAALASIEAANARPTVTLARLIAAQALYVAARRAAFAVVSEEMKYLPDDAVAKFQANRQAHQEFFERAVQQGIAAGEFDVPDPALAVHIVVGMVNSVYRWYRPAAGVTPAELGMSLAELALGGIATRTR